ncbi:MptD family putative ECF transporter S component [Propionibacterium australiense]|uniref:Conserved hypothetical CHP02185, integral membrane n=1 Tax=Propionibacterium australiense TaxID=119981 RepID=A0A383S706_9ACTN|nr:MptD family putative ECF transporter S component [Propionibacterium australiense]RLP09725.1 Trep_Strep domain-containing protein [Propionibacterium australiense]RLP10218.1 Trep_Strep domain-containing protein [Propionibacterium australiense]SYZ33194.1 Conserved hypothetical CHP02185, integral membrane [Propionibacterium australiense]VEH89353.1 conserved hypothetical integral membrane protein [Propionibacterium australiense]
MVGPRNAPVTGPAGRLTARDLITCGVFAALMLFFTMVGGALLAPNPVLTFAMPAAVALLTGPVYLLLIARVPRHGPVIIVGAVLGLIIFVTGMYWGWAVAYLVAGVVGDLVAGAGGFRSQGLNLLSFVLFSLNPLGSYAMLWISPDAYASYLIGRGTEQAYMDTMLATGTGWMLPLMIASILGCALVSGLLGRRLLRRQFEKAGVTAR